mmetsp:Transcript_9933/g.43302  ORF Transcript_9933/g.43302 Transcript_9933/m.43302 type:complete len:280 (-) Transcript_9933:45-884(-)
MVVVHEREGGRRHVAGVAPGTARQRGGESAPRRRAQHPTPRRFRAKRQCSERTNLSRDNASGSSTSRRTNSDLLYVPTRRLASGRATRIPSGVDIGDGAARLRASRVRPFTRAARAPAAAASCVVSSPHELLHPGRLLLLGPPVLHRVLRGLLEVRRVDDDLVFVFAVFTAGEDHGLVLLANLEAELLGRRRRGLGVLGEPVLERHLAQLTSLELFHIHLRGYGRLHASGYLVVRLTAQRPGGEADVVPDGSGSGRDGQHISTKLMRPRGSSRDEGGRG